MFLRRNRRVKDGKTHDYWSVVENRRLSDGRVVQRQVLYLGEINDSQREAWRKSIEVQDEGLRRQVSLFPAQSLRADSVNAIGVLLNELRLERPRQWGACTGSGSMRAPWRICWVRTLGWRRRTRYGRSVQVHGATLGRAVRLQPRQAR